MRVYTGCPRPGLRSAPRTRLVSGENSRQPEAQTALRGLCWLPGVSWPQLGMWLGDLGPGPAHHLPMAQGGCWPWGKGHRPPCPLADPDAEQWGGAAPPSEPAGGLRWTPPTRPLRASALRAARHWAAPPGTREVRRGHTCLPSLGLSREMSPAELPATRAGGQLLLRLVSRQPAALSPPGAQASEVLRCRSRW